jgi:hypothetical protein
MRSLETVKGRSSQTHPQQVLAKFSTTRVEKRDAVFDRDVEDVCLQEVEQDDSHLLIAAAGESSREPKPVLIVQFLFRQGQMKHESLKTQTSDCVHNETASRGVFRHAECRQEFEHFLTE